MIAHFSAFNPSAFSLLLLTKAVLRLLSHAGKVHAGLGSDGEGGGGEVCSWGKGRHFAALPYNNELTF